MNITEILQKLFYEERLGAGKKADFIKTARSRYPDLKVKDIKEWMDNQETNQINKKPIKHENLKITAPPRTFQIDIMWFRKRETLIPILLLIDIQSRKAFGYVLPTGKKEERAIRIVNVYKDFIKDAGGDVRAVEGDNEFSSKVFLAFNNENNIQVDTSVSKDEHITENGNKLGIIDRFVRTLRELISRYYSVVQSRTDNLQDVIDTVIATYNNGGHRTLGNKTPNEIYNDINYQLQHNAVDKSNNNIASSKSFGSGETVRILEAKGKLEKGSQKFSTDVKNITGREGYRYKVEGSSRKLKPSEIQKIGKVEGTLPKTEKEKIAKDKKKVKVINSLVNNAKMTPAEAKAAVKQLKEDAAVPALSTRRGAKVNYATFAKTGAK